MKATLQRSSDDSHNYVALRAALTAVSDGVVVLDEQDRIQAANEMGREMLDLDGAMASVASLEDVVDWPQLAAVVARCRSTRARQEFEAPFVGRPAPNRREEARQLAVTVTFRNESMVVIVMHDMTRVRQLESHRRDFVGNVSHELKTPLAAIRGFVETLVDDPEVPPQTRQRFLQRINRQVGRLSTLVSDLLTLSRLDEERIAAPADPVDIVQIMHEVVRDLQSLAEDKELELSVFAPDQPLLVIAEPEPLRQVFGNLVDNAIKYTAQGSVKVHMKVSADICTVDVIDTGLGLSTADKSRVFERFFRVDKARSTELGGTGLGLSIVKNTVQAIGGEVGVESKIGSGSRFWVRLPLRS